MDYIPVVDLSKISGESLVNPSDLASVGEEIFKALSGVGFAYLSNHGIDQTIIDTLFSTSKVFFEQPEEVKDKSLKDISKDYLNGYSKPGQELLNADSTYEIRESYDFCGNSRFYPESELGVEFGPAVSSLEEACKPLLKNLLRVLALSLKLEDIDYFVSHSKGILDDSSVSNHTTLRTIYYPAIPSSITPGTVRCVDHTDYGILTLLFQDYIGGLQVKSVSGNWIPANPIPGTILLNTGDLLEFWSGGIFPATHHQVLIPEIETKKRIPRQSIAFFVEPDDQTMISPLTGKSDGYIAITAREHGLRKLTATYAY